MQYFGECFYCTKRNRCLDAHRNTRCRDYEKRRRSGTDYKKCPKAAYILQIAPQAFREQAKRGMNQYSRVVSGKKKRTYEFYPYKAAEDLNVPVEHLEARSMEYEKQKGR